MEFRVREYRAEATTCCLAREAAVEHPLSSRSFRKENEQKKKGGIIDRTFIYKQQHHYPTSGSASSSHIEFDDAASGKGTFVDPLSGFAPESLASADKKLVKVFEKMVLRGASDEAVEAAAKEWDAYKMLMMKKYACTTVNTITLSTASDIISRSFKARGKSPTSVHLKELDDPEKNAEEEVKVISQQEYVMRLRELNNEIAQAWQQNERATALKLSIKVARLLSDTSVPQFYPTLFILVTDIMDTLGSLVWKRIKRKAEFDDEGNIIRLLPEVFTCTDVRREAKETCSNWFYRIGSIRELLPRIYLELAIFRSRHFLDENPLNVCQRLSLMIRGLADPLASAFAHLYLARCAQALIPYEKGFLITGLSDYITLFQRVLSGNLGTKMMKSYHEKRMYVRLMEPVIEWITRCIFNHADQERIIQLLRDFGVQPNEWKTTQSIHPVSVLVHFLLKQLPSTVVSTHALGLLKLVESSVDLSMAQYLNYRLLGFKFCECSPPGKLRLTILNEVLEVVTQYSDANEYLMVMDVYIDYILQNNMEDQLNMILDDISEHVRGIVVNDAELASLESIILKMISHFTDLTYVLSLDHFVYIVDVLYGSTRVSVCKHILTHISKSSQRIGDPVTRQFVFEVSKVLHDSIDSLSGEDDCKQIADTVKHFVQLVDFGGDLEQHLSFLIDCRATFSKMDLLKETLVHSSNYLAARTSKMAKGSQQMQVTDFVKACISFNEVTIPCVESILRRLYLFLETAEVALQNALVSHTEGLLKTAISSLQEIQTNNELRSIGDEEGIVVFVQKLAAFLIVVPGHPTLGAFYLLNDLLMLLDSQPWLMPGLRSIQALCAIVSSTTALAQKELPYRVENKEVVSNDELYFGDSAYNQELVTISNVLVHKILEELYQAPDSDTRGKQALDTCNIFLISFKATDEVIEHCKNLVKIAKSSSRTDDRYLQLTTKLLAKNSQNRMFI